MCVCIPCMHGCPQRLEGRIRSLKLELQVLGNHLVWVLAWELNASSLEEQYVVSQPQGTYVLSLPSP